MKVSHSDQSSDENRGQFGDGAIRKPILPGEPSSEGGTRLKIRATPYKCVDPRTIPRRPWIYGRQLLRGSVTLLISPGGVGKTAMMVGTALALVTARSLLSKEVWRGPKHVWIWNLEDSRHELTFLIEAARLQWGITNEDVGDRLYLDTAPDGAELCIATEDHSGFRILEPIVDELVEELMARKIDVLIVDPFVSCHSVSENNNTAMDAVAKRWARVAVRANCAILIVHHTRKLNGSEVTTEAGRGAVALPNAARCVIALNRMTATEAAQWGIQGDDRRFYFRGYDDKNNRAPPASGSDWYHLASVDVGNGPPNETGDNLQVVVPWSPPDAFTGITWEHLRDIQARLITAEAARKDPQSPFWAGETVASVLGLDVENRKGKDSARVKMLLGQWIASGALTLTREPDKNGNERPFIRPGSPAQPESSSP